MSRIDRSPVPNRDILLDFRGEFGRHCVLVAQAMQKEWGRDVVLAAAQGTLRLTAEAHPLLRDLARQRDRCNFLLAEIKARGIVGAIPAAQQAMSAVEAEWDLTLPRVNA